MFPCPCKDKYYSPRPQFKNIWLSHPPPVQKPISRVADEQKDAAEIKDTCGCTSAKGWPATIPRHVRPHHALYIPAPHPAPSALAYAWSPSMVLLGLSPPTPCSFCPFIVLKRESKRCHQPRAFNRLKGPLLTALHQAYSCNSHKATAAPERKSSLTQGDIEAHTGQQTPSKFFCRTLISPPQLWCSDYFCPSSSHGLQSTPIQSEDAVAMTAELLQRTL